MLLLLLLLLLLLHNSTLSLLLLLLLHNSIFFIKIIKTTATTILLKNRKFVFLLQSRVVKINRGFLQLLAHCPTHQCDFLLKTATPQQVHALVQALYNVLRQYIPFPEENRQKLLPYKDVLISLVELNVPYKKKKHILVQEGGGFIQDLLPPVISSLGFLLL